MKSEELFSKCLADDWTPDPEWEARQALAKARDLDAGWGVQATNRVKNRGERLSRVIWKGRQWAATKYGVECRDGCYVIERRRLWNNDEKYSWVMHMATKVWVDLEDFAEALRVARIFEMCRTGRGDACAAVRPRAPSPPCGQGTPGARERRPLAAAIYPSKKICGRDRPLQ